MLGEVARGLESVVRVWVIEWEGIGGKGETQRVESRGACDERGEEQEGGAEIHSCGGEE